jgi:hypothetical protein
MFPGPKQLLLIMFDDFWAAVAFGQSQEIAVLEKPMFFGNEALNMLVYLRIVHGRNLPRVSEALV